MNKNISNMENNFIPKYYQIKKSIIYDIEHKNYLPGDRLPSITEIIKQYKVSKTTARTVIYELIREGYAYVIQGKGCFVSDKSIAIKNEKKEIGKNNRIVCIMTDIAGEFYSLILQGILQVLQSKGYTLEIYVSGNIYSKETKILSTCLENKPSGLFIVPSFYNYNYKHLFNLWKQNVPVVLVDKRVKGYDFDYVASDNVYGAKKAVEYLIKSGHKKIVFLGRTGSIPGWGSASTIDERFEGYIRALKEHRIEIIKDLILKDFKPSYITWKDEVKDKLSKLFSKKIEFTAIFTPDIWLAMEIYRQLKNRGYNVPDDVSLVGFDDTYALEYLDIPLTTVRQDAYHIGFYSAKILLQRIKECKSDSGKIKRFKPIKKLLKTKLVIRNSVKLLKK